MLRDVLNYVVKWCPNIKFTLSDKDPSEVSTFRHMIMHTKHQLCCWHAIEYVKGRLAENTPLAMYDLHKAHAIFSFIDPTWVPDVTQGWLEEGVHMENAGNERPPEESAKDNEDIVSNYSIHMLPVTIFSSLQATPPPMCLPPVFILNHGDKWVPIWPNPPAIKASTLPQFCLPEYQSTIIEKFHNHINQHPDISINDKVGTHLTADEIYEGAVCEVYQYCWENELVQVWVYLWNCWYTPKQWPLWARSACPAIPPLKTTIVAKSLFKNIKHRDLA